MAAKVALNVAGLLQAYLVSNVSPTGRKFNSGAVGRSNSTTVELEVSGLVCVGKEVRVDTLATFVQECAVVLALRHPNIVQYLGLWLPGDNAPPQIVMEYLPHTLDHVLPNVKQLSLATKRSILCDIVRGLEYLHSRPTPIVHGKLTATNILLSSSLEAKISDVGKYLHLSDTSAMTPEMLAYLPPELRDATPRYFLAVDAFSFGQLSLYTLLQEFPTPTAPTYIDINNPGAFITRTEIQRRASHLQQLTDQLGDISHPAVKLIHRCFQSDPVQRPSTQQMGSYLKEWTVPADVYQQMTKLELIVKMRQIEVKMKKVESHHQAEIKHYKEKLQQSLLNVEKMQNELQKLKADQAHKASLPGVQAEPVASPEGSKGDKTEPVNVPENSEDATSCVEEPSGNEGEDMECCSEADHLDNQNEHASQGNEKPLASDAASLACAPATTGGLSQKTTLPDHNISKSAEKLPTVTTVEYTSVPNDSAPRIDRCTQNGESSTGTESQHCSENQDIVSDTSMLNDQEGICKDTPTSSHSETESCSAGDVKEGVYFYMQPLSSMDFEATPPQPVAIAPSADTPFTCPHCEVSFSQADLYKAHLCTHYEKPFACTQCDARFARSCALKRHMLMHTGEKPYPCTYCDARFRQSAHLVEHVRIHTGETPYACPHCDRKFKQLRTCKTHVATHTGVKPYACKSCDKKYYLSNALKRHEAAAHAGVTPYSCKYCGATFNHPTTAKRHESKHTGEKPYSCTQCRATFARADHLKAHKNTHLKKSKTVPE